MTSGNKLKEGEIKFYTYNCFDDVIDTNDKSR